MLLFIISQTSEIWVSDSFFLMLDSVYYHYSLVVDTLAKSAYDSLFAQVMTSEEKESSQALKIRGVKDFSFDMNQGFDQGLKVGVSGEFEGMKIEANLSDRSSSGQTMPISDIEKMGINLEAKNFYAGLGNLRLTLPFGIEDEIQGARIGLYNETEEKRINIAYALTRGSYQRMEFRGEEGKQSPYFLIGRVINGTERVYLTQGLGPAVLLKRDEDYHLDHEQSILSFTNKNIITNRSHITVEYHQATEDYLNLYQQTDARLSLDHFTINALYRQTSDDRDNPLGFTLTTAEIESLQLSGDSLRACHCYVDTSSFGSYEIEDGHFVYVGEGEGSYNVTFFYVGEDKGEYIYDPKIKGFSYQGPGLGNYSAQKFIPLPMNEQFYGIGIEAFKSLCWTVYGSNLDKNSYSALDDHDNYAMGHKFVFQESLQIVSIDAEYINYHRNLKLPMGREDANFYADWFLKDTLFEMAKLGLGLQPTTNLGIEFGYGILNRQHYRKAFVLRPFCFLFGYENVDTLDKIFWSMGKPIKRFLLHFRYENYEGAQYLRSSISYALNQQGSVGISGEYEKDRQAWARTIKFDLLSMPFKVSLGQRLYNDTTFLFGNVGFNLLYRNFSLRGSLQQSQRYSQLREELYSKVNKGEGNYVYDSVTGNYIEKEGGDYIRRVVLLKDFQRVMARNYGLEANYAKGIFDFRTRFNYLGEENFTNHNQDLRFTLTAEDRSLELGLSQDISNDARYALEAISSQGQEVRLIISFRSLHNHNIISREINRWGELVRQRRDDYGSKVGYELIQHPYLQPYTGYTYSNIYSDYFADLDLRLYAPKFGAIIGQAIKKKGRLELNTEFIYRHYNIADVPYFFSATEPAGLTKTLGLTGNFGLGGNTVLLLSYRIQFPPAEKFNHNLKFQTKIKF